MENSKISMVDISEKKEIQRTAIAEGRIFLKKNTIEQIRSKIIKKGDVLINAQLSAINAIKKTPELIFLAHPIPISNVNVEFDINEDKSFIKTTVSVKSIAKTGVELEAILGVQIALLTIWDMTKYLEKDEMGQYPSTKITDIVVLKKIKENI
ncbi:MAG: cyclic pyranopterin monophosphate synthase MoaC [Candidatus Helarchaeota archaeon]|nr:cyclic pyranopterin monophosphate synthase MoaC [Candidatus Helarchaeota archaeon]